MFWCEGVETRTVGHFVGVSCYAVFAICWWEDDGGDMDSPQKKEQ